jgi:hypothetical protein
MKGPDTKNQIPSRSKSFFPQTPFSVLLLSLALLPPILLQAASTGNVALFTPAGSGATAGQGAYVSASGGLNTYYSYFIEVPPGVSNLYVAVFDGDVGRGGTAEASPGRDRQRGGSWNTSCTYQLFRPDGVSQGSVTLSSDFASRFYENAWVNFSFADPVASPAAGHWELRVNMSSGVTGGDDINAFGIRAHDGNPGAGGTELNIYFQSFTNLGAQAGDYSTRNYTLYPYVTSGSTAYFLEDVDVMGVSTLHGPVFAQAPERPAPPQPSPTPTVTPSTPEPEDSDNDGYADWYEKEVGTDPLDAASRPALGDVNGDGQITIEDAIMLYQLAQSGDASLVPEIVQRGDVNQDSRITLEDAIILYRWVLRAPDFLVIPHREK